MTNYKFDGSEGGFIDGKQADKLRENYEKTIVKAHFYGREKIEAMLEDERVVGIRIYYGLGDNGEKELILYPVDSFGKDIIITKKNPSSAELILDISKKCPPYC